MNIRGPAHAFERFLLEKAQQLRLQRRDHFAYFIQEDRPAVGRLEQPALLHASIGERAALMTE